MKKTNEKQCAVFPEDEKQTLINAINSLSLPIVDNLSPNMKEEWDEVLKELRCFIITQETIIKNL